MKQWKVLCAILFVSLAVAAHPFEADDLRELVAQIRSVGPQGVNADRARAAQAKIAAAGPEAIAILLDGMDTPDTVAANWLRTAFDDVVTRARKENPASIPVDELREFVLDAKRQGRCRRLALDLLDQ